MIFNVYTRSPTLLGDIQAAGEEYHRLELRAALDPGCDLKELRRAGERLALIRGRLTWDRTVPANRVIAAVGMAVLQALLSAICAIR